MGDKTVFNMAWMDKTRNPEFADWIEPVQRSPHDAYCKVCRSVIHLSNMGRSSLISHSKGMKHIKNINKPAASYKESMSAFTIRVPRCSTVTSENVPSAVTNTAEKTIADSAPVSGNAEHVSEVALNAEHAVTSAVGLEFRSSELKLNKGYFLNDKVTTAEILWCLKTVVSHYSYNSASNLKELFTVMFPDSKIAGSLALGSTKLAYFITYGLAPYFTQHLINSVKKCSEYVICFDEALNRVVQKGQMDIVVRFWNDTSNQVQARYLTSAFLGHSTADDLLKNFKESLQDKGLTLTKLIQVSMDGPNVNWKFLDQLKTDICHGDSDRQLLDIGSCGLHVVHGAFQNGHKASGWKVNSFLRSIYTLFKDSPARRADYVEITGSSLFPKKFCQVRWVENAEAAHRAVDIFENIKKFVSKKAKNLPSTSTASVVISACNEKSTLPQLSFFASVAMEIEPFLKQFQTAAPMAPYLYDDLAQLLRSLMSRFIKRSIMDEAKNFSQIMLIDVLNKENRCSYKDLDIGVAAKKALGTCKLSDKEILTFRMECSEFLSALTHKLIEKCPIKYRLTRAVSCLIPSAILTSPTSCERKMNTLVEIMYLSNNITAIIADKIKGQFQTLCSSAANNDKFKTFKRQDERLDTFWYNVIGNNSDASELWSVVKMMLILSHGNATVESGFSVNGSILVENLQEHSVVAQRVVYDSIQAAGGIMNVTIDKSMMQYVRSARSAYMEELKKKREKDSEMNRKLEERKRAAEIIKTLKAKKAKLMTTAASEASLIDSEIAEMEKMTKHLAS